jgi:hypothetical protein
MVHSEDVIILLLLIAVIWVIKSIVVFLWFRPYRNKFMVWYMERFSSNFRAAKRHFDDLIEMEELCRFSEYTRSRARYSFFERLQKDERYRTMEYAEQIMNGKPLDSIESVNSLLVSNSIPSRPMECFIAFYGHGIKWHKVMVMFDLRTSIRLQSISFFYNEERGWNTYHRMFEEKRFSSDDDDDDSDRGTYVPVPDPVYGLAISATH